MSDVASVAGVSAQTVSRTLRGESNVSDETRERVLTAVASLGYRRNNAARMLSSGHSRLVGLVVLRDAGQYSRAAITAGVESAATEAGFAVQIATIPTLDTAQMERALQRLAGQDVEGIVIAVPLTAVTPRIQAITEAIPTVTLDGSRTPGMPAFGVDQFSTGKMATAHLLERGHEQVWHVAGPSEWVEGRQRREGWAAAHVDAGRTAPPPLVGDWTPESGYRHGLVLAHIPDVTAVFVASDEMAFGVLKAFREEGRRVPEDVSVVGVDDIALAAFAVPPLTTVRQNFAQSGAAAVQALLEQGAGRPSDHAWDEPVLVTRDSVASRPHG